MNLLTLSKEIREGKISDDKLVECLDIHHNQVMMNAMSQIAKKEALQRKNYRKIEAY